MDLTPFLLSLELATLTAGLLLLLSLPLVFGVHHAPRFLKTFCKALISLPLVLPPTVLGYYLLIALRPDGWLAQLTGIGLAFSFGGLLVGSLIFSLPFMVNPILSAVEEQPKAYEEVAATLGMSRWSAYWRILLPNVRSSIRAGVVMAFAHTIGEFGVVLMIGGNIPGLTRVASIEIYHQVEAGRYGLADQYALILLGFALVLLILIYSGNKVKAKF